MRNIKIIFEYDGTRYQGWQKPHSLSASSTLCAKITDLLTRILDQPVTLVCAEKTDSGVHAYSQVVNFHTDSSISCAVLLEAMNQYLPKDIVVLTVTEEEERFRSDLSYKTIRYIYHLYTNDVLPVPQWNYAYSISEKLNLEQMEKAAKLLIGKHDFRNFSGGKKKKGTEKTLSSVRFVTHGTEFFIVLEGNHFLHQMPTLISAALVEIGANRRSTEYITHIFSGEEAPPAPLPSKGLFLDVEHHRRGID